MTDYVAGLLFHPSRKYVALIRKNRPDWQAGKLNGIGGKIEPGERPENAMSREFAEEAGLVIYGWDLFAGVKSGEHTILFYRAFFNEVFSVTSMTDEHVGVYKIDNLDPNECLPNLSWLIPLAVYEHDVYAPIEAVEI